jgi:hypothetical protein
MQMLLDTGAFLVSAPMLIIILMIAGTVLAGQNGHDRR